jgi:hypothetical protein
MIRTRREIVADIGSVEAELTKVNMALKGTKTDRPGSVERGRLRSRRAELVEEHAALNREIANAKHDGQHEDFQRLLDAIYDHKRACDEADIEPEPHDLELWSHVSKDIAARVGTALR